MDKGYQAEFCMACTELDDVLEYVSIDIPRSHPDVSELLDKIKCDIIERLHEYDWLDPLYDDTKELWEQELYEDYDMYIDACELEMDSMREERYITK